MSLNYPNRSQFHRICFIMISTRGTIVYTPTAQDLFKIYLEICEIIVCFTVAILREMFTLTVQAVKFCQAWQDWRCCIRIGPVDMGFDLQQDWDDLEVVWLFVNYKDTVYGYYWCRESGWVKVDW